MGAFIINPGTGPVDGDEQLAIAAAAKLLEDLATFPQRGDGLEKYGLPARPPDPIITTAEYRRVPERDADGYYGFIYSCGEHSATVDIPGLPLERLRWVKDPGQNIWNFQRLYINDSSFVWFYVISIARRELAGVMEE